MPVRFIIRKEDPPLIMGRFTSGDIVMTMMTVFPVLPVYLVTQWPFPVVVGLCTMPVAFYVMMFRVGRPPSYFKHWLRYRLRPKRWRYCLPHADTLLGVRTQWLLCARPLPSRSGRREIWMGPGFRRLKPPPDGGAQESA